MDMSLPPRIQFLPSKIVSPYSDVSQEQVPLCIGMIIENLKTTRVVITFQRFLISQDQITFEMTFEARLAQ